MTRFALAAIALLLVACSDETLAPTPPPAPGGWGPGTVQPPMPSSGPRGQLDLRGLIHAHTVYSHDACDGEPRDGDTGPINEECFDDFRRSMCVAQHNFIMLSDHRTSFGRTEFPEVLLYRPERGDELVERADIATANWASCPDGEPLLLMAGNESAESMPVGLEGHVSDDVSERQSLYGAGTAEAIEALKAHGAVVLMMHTEEWTPEHLTSLPFDGFEMYNLHANLLAGVGVVLELISKLEDPSQLPHPDLLMLPIMSEPESYLGTWAKVLASGARRTTTMGTDCHRNAFKQLMSDGER